MPNVWTQRVWDEHRAGTLTRAYRDVLLTLQTYRGYGGLICPSHETLAERARCKPRTVGRAMKQAQRLGLVEWAERRVRNGWRWLRTSNTYWLTIPDAPPDATLKPVWPPRATTGHIGAVGESEKKEEAREGKRAVAAAMAREAAAMPDLLAARRLVTEAMLARRSILSNRHVSM